MVQDISLKGTKANKRIRASGKEGELSVIQEKYGTKWSEEETILAFYYYCLIPFGKIHKGNPEIIRIATLLGRTPSSVSRKMGNLGHFDPELRKRNVSGLSNASKTDEAVVAHYLNNWESLVQKAQSIEASFEAALTDTPILGPSVYGGERETITRTRINQDFFRGTVLSSYQNRCCITGIDVPTLLIASHIKPWSISDPETERTNPCNGLCLNALHDKAFDKGLLTVLPDFTIRVSSKLKEDQGNKGVEWIIQFDKQRIQLPERFFPKKEFLEYHNDVIFEP